MIRDCRTTWFCYLFKKHILLFAACFFLLFTLFVITDLMIHVKDIFDPKTEPNLLFHYYVALFSRRFDALILFSLVTSSTIFFTSLSKKNELIPLLNAGLSMKRQSIPFFCVAFLAMSAMWMNSQYLYPTALQKHEYIEKTSFGKEKEEAPTSLQERMGTIYLRDGSKLFFLQNDVATRRLFDVFWLPHHNTVFHIEELSYLNPLVPQGKLIDVVERDSAGIVIKTETHLARALPEIRLSEEDVMMASTPTRYMSIEQLFTMSVRMHRSTSTRSHDIFITFLLKMLNPLTCLLAIAVPIPYCFSFRKGKHPVLLLFFFLAALFIFQLVIQLSTVLAHIPAMPSVLVLLLPWVGALFFSFRKLKHFLSQV